MDVGEERTHPLHDPISNFKRMCSKTCLSLQSDCTIMLYLYKVSSSTITLHFLFSPFQNRSTISIVLNTTFVTLKSQRLNCLPDFLLNGLPSNYLFDEDRQHGTAIPWSQNYSVCFQMISIRYSGSHIINSDEIGLLLYKNFVCFLILPNTERWVSENRMKNIEL